MPEGSPEEGRTLANIGMWLGIIHVIIFILIGIAALIFVIFFGGLMSLNDFS
jgi:hypothetical protein